MAPDEARPEAATRVRQSIPLSTAVPILTLVVTAVLWGYDLRTEIREGTVDRFKGADMDRFIERLQVRLDDHTRETDSPEINLPGWRPNGVPGN